jgi:hypothetical protein
MFTVVSYQFIEGSENFLISPLSFPRRRESRNPLITDLDARLRGHDRKKALNAQLMVNSLNGPNSLAFPNSK